jgi:serine/threonine protein kinase
MTAASSTLDGRYRLGALIGRGAMSDVYRALDEQTGEQVAVKIVRSNDSALAARLAREARALHDIDHPNLVRLLNSGVVDTRAYLVMTYVNGPTLEARLRGGALEPGVSASLGTAVANALAYIHARGIVHRDVKPANILITTDGQVKLADFGVARLADASTLTSTGSTLGTVAYMAPEQLENHEVGPGADIWSLGTVLLESLTGRRLYTGAPSEVIARRLAAPVPIPADLPGAWLVLLRTMLAREPTERPTAGEVARQLRRKGFSVAWDPWGQPLVAPEPSAIPGSPTTSSTRTRPDANRGAGRSAPSTPPARQFRWRRAAVAGAVAVASAGLVVWAVGRSDTASPTKAQAPKASAPPTTAATPPVRTAATELSALSRDVNAGMAAGSIAATTGQALTSDARQAISAAGTGNRVQATADLQRALQTVSTGTLDGSLTASEAGVLQRDVSALAATLGVPATPISTPPSTATHPTAGPGPDHSGQPPGHAHRGDRKD